MPWGSDTQHYVSLNGYAMIRVMPHVDLHSGPDLCFFTEIQFDFIVDRNGGPRTGIDENRGDISSLLPGGWPA